MKSKKNFLEHQINRADRQAVLFGMSIELAGEEFNIPGTIKILTLTDDRSRKEGRETIDSACDLSV